MGPSLFVAALLALTHKHTHTHTHNGLSAMHAQERNQVLHKPCIIVYILCYVMLCYVILYYTILYYTYIYIRFWDFDI